jgi:NAD(P)-dependent dehydrogenase (short-subunit alcohol dehydrogenase family)
LKLASSLKISTTNKLQAAAKVWAEAHASGIVLAARRVSNLDALAAELQPLSPETKFVSVKLDISVEEDVKNLYATVQKEFGRPADIVLNNAGYLDDDSMVGETEPATWWKGLVSLSILVHK